MTELQATRRSSVIHALKAARHAGSQLVALGEVEEATARALKLDVCMCEAHRLPHVHVKARPR